MEVKPLKNIGTTDKQEVDNISSAKPWEELIISDIPFSPIGTPNGYMFTQGSACGSLPTVSAEGWKYNADIYIWRRDGTAVDRDRYLGSVGLNGDLSILLVPKLQTPDHHVGIPSSAFDSLPTIYQGTVAGILANN